jgi:hypothetical protein
MRYTGSCHCGSVKFEVEGEITGAVMCNCSICRRKGVRMAFFPRSALTLLMPEDKLASYTFNKHVIHHRFCPTCGIHTHGDGVDPKGNAMAAVNINCIENIDVDALPVQHYDGRSL